MKQAATILGLSIALAFAWIHLFNYKPETVYWSTQTVQNADGETITQTRCSNVNPNTLDK